MKKGIVMEQHRHYTIIMTKEGMFQKAMPIQRTVIGAEVSYTLLNKKKKLFIFANPMKQMKQGNVPTQLLVTVCLFVFLFVPLYLMMGENETYAYVNVEINPSIELEVDEDMAVHSIRPLNNEASTIVREMPAYQNKQVDKVIEMIMDKSEETEFINDKKSMLVGVSYVKEGKESNSIPEPLKMQFPMDDTEWQIASFHVPKGLRDTAQNNNKSMNEVLATALKEDNTTVECSQAYSVNDEERAIITNFYNMDTENHSEGDVVNPEKYNNEKEKPQSRDQHPSEMEEKNGEINSKNDNNQTTIKVNKIR
ncbi:hypothetical protein J2Z83_002269 [Virgibacillus natechei]|uniref:RsgI N-terminal anti-sigma domain-containing protein n=1 Tax=Virgibacillus natechei TaxID=1216297 RepID=A0ABS4IGS7_9BACI|nr:hypothetical protein [Virgibacillus natechei]MBP1970153.1 hypothetical protein [Virgibacillus natechei]UZD14224.1 hypothetical protein OLD84_06835 [Virgibacillus natechei]